MHLKLYTGAPLRRYLRFYHNNRPNKKKNTIFVALFDYRIGPNFIDESEALQGGD